MKGFNCTIRLCWLISVLSLSYAATYTDGLLNECETPLKESGICVSLKHCPQVVNLFRHLPVNDATLYSKALQRSCGQRKTRDNYSIVCCTRVVVEVTEEPFVQVTTAPKIPTTSTTITTTMATEEPIINTTSTTTTTSTEVPPTSAALRSTSETTHSRTETNATRSVADDVPRRLPTESDGCGHSNMNFGKIVGGHESKIGAWPWMALLGYEAWSLQPFRCGGSLITARHVLTAAHCIERGLSFIRLGEFDLAIETETKHLDINIEKVMKHAGYSSQDNGERNDIALIKLERNVEFSELISPICMPTSTYIRTKSYINSNPFVAGWGNTMEGGSPSNVLRHLQIPIHNNSVCQTSHSRFGLHAKPNNIDETVLCAGALIGGMDTCQGDSGGPLMIPEPFKGIIRYYLIGIISYGIGCARTGVPGIYTSTQYFMDWVTEQLKEM